MRSVFLFCAAVFLSFVSAFMSVGFLSDAVALKAYENENAANLEAQSDDEKAYDLVSKYLKELSTGYPSRVTGGAVCDAAAEYLIGFFYGLSGIEPYGFGSVDSAGIMRFDFNDPFDAGGGKINAKNLVFVKKSPDNPNRKQVIIGAHYDNSTVSGTSDEGVSGGATGVAVLMTLAELLQDTELPFDVVFALFSGEEYGYFGSSRFVLEMTEERRRNTLLYVNLNYIGGGDNCYLYADEIKRIHADYILEKAALVGMNIDGVPDNARIIPVEDLQSGLPYTAYAMADGHAAFYKAGINIAAFFSANYSLTQYFKPQEAKYKFNIADTEADTFENYMNNYGDKGIKTCVGIVFLLKATLMSPDFTDVMEKSGSLNKGFYEFIQNRTFLATVYVLTALILILFTYLMYRKIGTWDIRGDKSGGAAPNKGSEDVVVFEEFGI